MISVPWPLRPAPAPPALPEPLPARSAEPPDPLNPDAPERDCSLLVDSRDWAIDHSFYQNWERPGGRPPERSSSLPQQILPAKDATACYDLFRTSRAHQSRGVISCSPGASARGDCIPAECTYSDGTRCAWQSASWREPLRTCRRCSYTRSPGFPLPSPGPRPQRDPGCHPGRGLTLSPPASGRT